MTERKNIAGNITVTISDVLTAAANKRTVITGIRIVNPGSAEIYAEVNVNAYPVFVGSVPAMDGIYDKNSCIELVPGQKLQISAKQAGLKYFISYEEVVY